VLHDDRNQFKVHRYPKELAHKQGITKLHKSSKHELNSELNVHTRPLCCSIPIVTVIIRGFHICSHQ